jgi:precorrin-6A/cobalt-precorrin-6A reductase
VAPGGDCALAAFRPVPIVWSRDEEGVPNDARRAFAALGAGMTLLLLAGTGEAQEIARALAEKGVRVIASLAGGSRVGAELPVPTRKGGFGGEAGFRRFLEEEGITAVLDATHPFAHRISGRTARVCRALSMPYCQLLRPPWEAGRGDKWHEITSEEALAPLVAPGEVVFLATGRQTLERFANPWPRTDHLPPDRPAGGAVSLSARRISRRPSALLGGRARRRSFASWGSIGWWSRTRAARPRAPSLWLRGGWGCRVAMIARPPQPDALKVATRGRGAGMGGRAVTGRIIETPGGRGGGGGLSCRISARAWPMPARSAGRSHCAANLTGLPNF